jgi:hypothetical protein
MEFEIVPYVHVGPIEFGLTRTDLRRRLNSPADGFRKSPTDTVLTDAFDTLGFHVFYNAEDRCEAVEFYRLTMPTLYGRNLLEQPFADARVWLQSLDPGIQAESGTLISHTYGLGLYAPSALHDLRSPVEAVIVFRRGYYD